MSDHEVQIELPITAVRKAWRRYVGLVDVTSDGESERWRADGRDLTAIFASDGPSLTTVAVHGPEAAADGAQSLAALVEGFVAYVDAVHRELDASSETAAGTAPVGPDGTPHMEDQPTGLGTDGQSTADASTVAE